MEIKASLLGLLLPLTACSITADRDLEPAPEAFDPLRSGGVSLDTRKPSPCAAAMDLYLGRYGIDPGGHRHYWGRLDSDEVPIFCHVFKADRSKGTVVVMHGYLDHSGSMAEVINHLVSRDYDVVVFDTEGHGLSGGTPTSIRDFEHYGRHLDTVLAHLEDNGLPGPHHVVAHSTGAAVVMEHLLGGGGGNLDRVVLLAPLVRPETSALGHGFAMTAGTMVDHIPRAFRVNSSDPAFLDSVRSDPLHAGHISLKWYRALMKWNRQAGSHAPCAKPIHVVQGTADEVVDWDYNLPWLEEKFPSATIVKIDAGKHQLMNESPPLLARVRREIDVGLGENDRAGGEP